MSSFWKTVFGKRPSEEPDRLPYDLITIGGDSVSSSFSEIEAQGFIPILHGGRDTYQRLIRNYRSDHRPIEQIVELARSFDVDRWLANGIRDAIENQDPEAPLEGDWPEYNPAPNSRLSCNRRLSEDGFLPEVLISKIPAQEHWQAPCFLKFGSWNSCPSPEVHGALFRRWGDLHRAKVRSITADVVELEVGRPILTHEEALKVAREHHVYCGLQGAENLQELAASLVGSTTWFFWWD